MISRGREGWRGSAGGGVLEGSGLILECKVKKERKEEGREEEKKEECLGGHSHSRVT